MNCCIQTVQGDVTKVDDVEAIVNAAYCEANRPGLRSKMAAFRF